MIEECFDPKVPISKIYIMNYHFTNIRFHKLQKGYYRHQS